MCSIPFYMQSYIMFLVTSETLTTNPNSRNLKHKIKNKCLKILIAFQVVVVVFVVYFITFPNVSCGLVQIQWNLGALDDFEKFHWAKG